jgi:hypothetical protein
MRREVLGWQRQPAATVPGDDVLDDGTGLGQHEVAIGDHRRGAHWMQGRQFRGREHGDRVPLVALQRVWHAQLFAQPEDALGTATCQGGGWSTWEPLARSFGAGVSQIPEAVRGGAVGDNGRMTDTEEDNGEKINQPRLWRDNGWTARVIKNEDDDGWAVAMTPEGRAEPALVGPWTMGRDKKNPKPLDTAAFNTLVKTAAEFVRRHEQQLHATLHREIAITHNGERITVTLDIEPDEENPSATLRATDAMDVVLAEVRVAPSFTLTRSTAGAWAEAGFSPATVRAM